jgi:pimeloyl-ACP methyl ester carboxylesterase
VACPVHCLLGTRDQMTLPKAAQALVAALRAEVHRLPAGHSLMSEVPDDVLNVLRQVLNEKEGQT